MPPRRPKRLKLYLVDRTGPTLPDEMGACVVAALDPHHAREMAAQKAQFEGKAVWQTEAGAVVTEIGTSTTTEPTHILLNIRWGQ